MLFDSGGGDGRSADDFADFLGFVVDEAAFDFVAVFVDFFDRVLVEGVEGVDGIGVLESRIGSGVVVDDGDDAADAEIGSFEPDFGKIGM